MQRVHLSGRSGFVRMLFTLLLLVPLFGIATVVSSAQPAMAGSHGQQIIFTCPEFLSHISPIRNVSIYGRNQAGQMVRWFSPAVYRNSSGVWFTRADGWWWSGQARIYWQNINGSWSSIGVNVPQSQNGDWVTYSCN